MVYEPSLYKRAAAKKRGIPKSHFSKGETTLETSRRVPTQNGFGHFGRRGEATTRRRIKTRHLVGKQHLREKTHGTPQPGMGEKKPVVGGGRILTLQPIEERESATRGVFGTKNSRWGGGEKLKHMDNPGKERQQPC